MDKCETEWSSHGRALLAHKIVTQYINLKRKGVPVELESYIEESIERDIEIDVEIDVDVVGEVTKFAVEMLRKKGIGC